MTALADQDKIVPEVFLGDARQVGSEIPIMRTSQASFAEAELRQQVEIFGESRISLDSLWRAAGEPAGAEAMSWVVLAEPILSGLGEYLAILKGRHLVPPVEPTVLWTWTDESCDPWLNGDLMSNAWVARIYANYLDGRN